MALHPGHYQDAPGTDPLDTRDVGAIVLRWPELRQVAAVDPWPSLQISWQASGGLDALTFRPARPGLDGVISPWLAPEEFAAEVEELIRFVQRHTSVLIDRGWIDIPELAWEQVGSMPDPPSERAVVGDGAFRAAPRPVEDVAIAVRAAPTPYEAMLEWLASTPDRPWREHPRRVRASDDFLYVERRDRTMWRAPLDVLRARLGGSDEDAIYVFGRRATVLLTHRAACPVRALLDARLERAPADPAAQRGRDRGPRRSQ